MGVGKQPLRSTLRESGVPRAQPSPEQRSLECSGTLRGLCPGRRGRGYSFYPPISEAGPGARLCGLERGSVTVKCGSLGRAGPVETDLEVKQSMGKQWVESKQQGTRKAQTAGRRLPGQPHTRWSCGLLPGPRTRRTRGGRILKPTGLLCRTPKFN